MVGEPAQPAVDQIFSGSDAISISAVNLAEVIDHLVRVRGNDPDTVRDRIHLLMVAGLEVEPVWMRAVWLATSLRSRHYHRTRSAVSLADCICIATAITLETDLATTDPALARVARDAGLAVIALPDSNGELP